MPAGLRTNLIGAIVGTAVVLVLSVVALQLPLVRSQAAEVVRADLREAARAVADELTQGARAEDAAERIAAQRLVHIRVVGSRGELVGDSQPGAHPGAAERGRGRAHQALLARARDQGTATGTRIGPAGERVMEVAMAVGDGRVVRASRPLQATEAAREGLRDLLLFGGLLALGLAAIGSLVLSRTVVHPVRQLTQVAGALARGELQVRSRSQRADELGTLGRTLDEMADQLASQLHTLRAEKARLRTVLDAMVEAVFVTDPRGRIVLTNAALHELLGEEATGRTAVEVLRSAELHDAVRDARHGRATSVELDIRIRREMRTFSAQIAPLPDDAGVVAVLHDITELKMADRIRRDFVANASHELRTPLSAVRGFAETLRDGAAQDSEAASRFADRILKHTIRLQTLVDDLLALSRAESPEENYQVGAVELGAVAAEATAGLEPKAVEESLELVVEPMDELPPVRGSERALDQIVVNLVDNGIKYTPKEGRITVRAYERDDRVVLEVSDTGPGIPSQHLDRVFERFYRVDKGRSREVGGTGLGLSIVRHLASRIGAELEVDSEVGRGSTFRVVLQRAQPAADQAEPTAAS